jgi:hypothetical protein
VSPIAFGRRAAILRKAYGKRATVATVRAIAQTDATKVSGTLHSLTAP